MTRIVVHNHMPARKTQDLGERTGTIVAHGGEWWYRKPNETLRYGPFKSASEAAAAARKAGVVVDAEARASDQNAFEHGLSREQEERNRDSEYARHGLKRVKDSAPFEKGTICYLRQPQPLPSGNKVKLRVRVMWANENGTLTVRSITPGLYEGADYTVPPSELSMTKDHAKDTKIYGQTSYRKRHASR